MADTTIELTLPDQPPVGTGSLERFALGGDGFSAPSGMYVLRNLRLVADGTGAGVNSIQVQLDRNYCSMFGYVTFSLSQTTGADEVFKTQLVGARIASQLINLEAIDSGVNQPTLGVTWLPPAFIIAGEDPPTLSVFVRNLGTDILLMSFNLFLYDIRAREVTNYGLLVSARGGV